MGYIDVHSPSDGGQPTVQDYIDYICSSIDRGDVPDVPERNVDAILSKHMDRVSRIRAEVTASVSSTDDKLRMYVDCDEWILRYCLSFPKDSAAVGAIKRCLEWRAQPTHSKIAADLASNVRENKTMDLLAGVKKYTVAGGLGLTRNGGFPIFVRNGIGSSSRMMGDKPEETYHAFLAQREMFSQIQLGVMQAKRRIVKLSLIIDLADTCFSELSDMRFSNMFGKISKVSGDVWPQLLHKLVLVNMPSFFFGIFSLVKRILPKKTLEKMELFKNNVHFLESDFVKTTLRPECIPSFLGGSLKDLPPLLTGALLYKDLRLTTVRVPARGSKKVHVHVTLPGPATIEYEFSVPGFGVEFSAFVERGTFETDRQQCSFTSRGELETLLEPVKLKDNDSARLCGTWQVAGPCQVTVLLGNTWSKLRSKDAVYMLTVIPVTSSTSGDDLDMSNIAATMADIAVACK